MVFDIPKRQEEKFLTHFFTIILIKTRSFVGAAGDNPSGFVRGTGSTSLITPVVRPAFVEPEKARGG